MEPGLEYEGCHDEDEFLKSVDMLELLQNLSLKLRRAFGYGDVPSQCSAETGATSRLPRNTRTAGSG
jgi:hypothetical protein